ncbi:cellulose synthase operon protein YhjU [Legionella wadsworthii]|uniref:Cellulose synthase operon protein YhjU n=1 Tax=Legionella wadsworthii TaxID=28088 RepID=A0A378LPY0_9GAMM|nr:cellulose biosynthesis protein BcsG [Legionella wadsworthii]STY28747.1 cellulose synthase operon protein YhjU [Legionella wadsworthii]
MTEVKQDVCVIENTPNIWGNWRGLGAWNFYFILKFAFLWYGYLNFHPLYNLTFLAYLLFPLPSLLMHRIRNWIAIPIGLILLYYDTWLPGFDTIMHQGGNLFDFSPQYLLMLLNRFINWNLIALSFVLLVGYLFLSQWLRVTVFTVIILCWLNILTLKSPSIALPQHEQAEEIKTNPQSIEISPVSSHEIPPPTDDNLNNFLNDFYKKQKTLRVDFPSSLPSGAESFDIFIIQICSLAWADIKSVQLENHPMWKKFDILFKNFNSATSYSGPAALRLLRSSCGQTTQSDLTQPASPECYLFNNLTSLGYKPELMMDHDGIFGDFLQDIREDGDLQNVPMLSREGISPDLIGFNGHNISNDGQLFERWMNQTNSSKNNKNITFFNVISLHDGNLYMNKSPAPYRARAQKFFDQIDTLFAELENSQRKVLILFIPEHGANLPGDKLQISGLRDIPSPSITDIPVGLKFVGMKSPHEDKPLILNNPSSYLAISDLISRTLKGLVFEQPKVDWQALTRNLPQTNSISETEAATVVDYYGTYFIRLSGDQHWIPYPK